MEEFVTLIERSFQVRTLRLRKQEAHNPAFVFPKFDSDESSPVELETAPVRDY